MPKDTSTQQDLGPLQLEAALVLWRHGKLTVEEVHATINGIEGGRHYAYTTILTILRNMAKRGYCSQTKEEGERAHFFEMRISRRAYAARIQATLAKVLG